MKDTDFCVLILKHGSQLNTMLALLARWQHRLLSDFYGPREDARAEINQRLTELSLQVRAYPLTSEKIYNRYSHQTITNTAITIDNVVLFTLFDVLDNI